MPDKTVSTSDTRAFPQIRNVGLSGVLVSFSDTLSEAGNRAALAFRARIQAEAFTGVLETATSLTSTFVSFDPDQITRGKIYGYLSSLLESESWENAALPNNRRLWRIPAVFGGDFGPQLEQAALLAGLTAEQAVQDITASRLRVMTIGFAPGQPYLGSLSDHWDIPRQTGLTRRVPVGAIVVAIRQLVLFTAETPTGWRHVGQTGFRGFRPDTNNPFALSPGDEVQFSSVDAREYVEICAQDQTGDGGARWEALT